MRTTPALILAAALLSGPAAGQTTGVAGVNDLRVGGGGSGGTSCVPTGIPTAGALLIEVDGSPGDAVILAAAATCSAGAVPLGGKSVDLDPATLDFLADGTGTVSPGTPAALWPFFVVPAGGTFSLTIGYSCPSGPLLALQAALVGPAGICPTQAHDVTCFTDPCALANAGNDLNLGDDTSATLAFTGANSTFTYYGNAYVNCHVNSNGNVTFCAGDVDFSPTPAEFLGTGSTSELPRIAPAWRDFQPNVAGSVHAAQDDTTLTVMWCGVRQFACVGDSNTFSAVLDKVTGDVTLVYGMMGLCMQSPDTLIAGLSAGYDAQGQCPLLPAVPSTAPEQDLFPGMPGGAGPYDAVWQEFFTGAEPYDLPAGHVEVFQPAPGPTYVNATN